METHKRILDIKDVQVGDILEYTYNVLTYKMLVIEIYKNPEIIEFLGDMTTDICFTSYNFYRKDFTKDWCQKDFEDKSIYLLSRNNNINTCKVLYDVKD